MSVFHRNASQRTAYKVFSAALFLLAFAINVRATTIDFEGLSDGTSVTTQYSGLTFSNAIILSAGISLNEFEFPPHSGVNVVSDNGGPIQIDFSTPVSSFSGYFTYAEALNLVGFDSSNNSVASATSLFTNNEALSGDLGSSPNEFLEVAFAGGISKITITGDPGGGSFVLDDATIGGSVTSGNGGSSTPEPGSFVLLISGGIICIFLRRKRE